MKKTSGDNMMKTTFFRHRTKWIIAFLLCTICFAAVPQESKASEPFLAEIRIFGGDFAPRGWALCDGQILSINQNQSLYSLLGTTYGGDGRTSFALPDLRGRIPVHVGEGITLGEKRGSETHTLTPVEVQGHIHPVKVNASSATGDSVSPAGNVWAKAGGLLPDYKSPGQLESRMAEGAVVIGDNTPAGASHENMPPFQVLNYIIAIQGLFPSRN